ncbi:hypothetical protein AVEN_154142-1 [Araneus ventricosus]|uniref:Uncharacterized protein n=1 Tax=Araneus ventricosus TaxID=182803 RepID=A0A4Y2JHD9_ARAVE|nr:hypothetical protein AVEN_266645-1 [Araneus ventricosus]GBM89170.1 hypothetical protein AVEN_22960-1 [Araneus ventricosus]GBM89183.1 hypothetical protein AVEN_33621-1 [Araneus ventricosus]GBM89305.1 hypothetical protein AVEN_154142-1 [Araneus ventricosus]
MFIGLLYMKSVPLDEMLSSWFDVNFWRACDGYRHITIQQYQVCGGQSFGMKLGGLIEESDHSIIKPSGFVVSTGLCSMARRFRTMEWHPLGVCAGNMQLNSKTTRKISKNG